MEMTNHVRVCDKYTPQATHHAKFDFDPTTWVVWANSQFATPIVKRFSVEKGFGGGKRSNFPFSH